MGMRNKKIARVYEEVGWIDVNDRVKLEKDDTTKDWTSSKFLGKNDMEDDFNALLSKNCASTLKCKNSHVEAICELIGTCVQ